jgi:hypothetical protein
MDDLFWGREYEDVTDWAERLTMVAEVRDLTPDKLFKIAKLNLRGRVKEWFRRLQPAPTDWTDLRTLMVQKYGNIDADDIRMKMDVIKQEPKERVQKYFERIDRLFQRGKITDVEQRRRFLARLRPEIRKLCVVRVFADIEELVAAAIEVERVLGELGETPFEPLKEEREEGTEENTMEKQVAALKSTLINFFKGNGPISAPASSSNVLGVCQICQAGDHRATTCPRLNDARPKCAKCNMPHRTENCGIKCTFCTGLGHSEDRCWKKPRDEKTHTGTANFVEVLLSDEEAMLQQLNRLCGNEKIFSYTRVPRRRVLVEVAPTTSAPSPEIEEEGVRVNQETTVKSKILSHFIKGKIALSPMETILMIPGELEHLENLVKLARRKKDAELVSDQVSVVSPIPAIRRICVNKTNKSKALHLPVEMNRYIIERLIDTGASMSVMAAAVVKEMGMMHSVVDSESFKMASGVVTQALGRIDEVVVNVGGVHCTMTFMVVDTYSYDVLIGLDFLMKIGAVVDVERGLIQIRRGPGTNIEVLPLTTVNLLQNVNVEFREQDATIDTRGTSRETLEVNLEKLSLGSLDMDKRENVSVSKTDTDDDSEEGLQPVEQIEEAFEFENIEFEELVLQEGLEQILQLTLQDQADEFMKEEISESDDYGDWIQWVSDAEERRTRSRQVAGCTESPAVLQTHRLTKDEDLSGRLATSTECSNMNTRWEEISQRIPIDHYLREERKQQLWEMLGSYQDVFAWSKRELGCCTMGEHSIDTQGFPPCNMPPGRLSFWEETEVKRQIDALIDLGKMKPNNSEYACQVTLPVKKDGSRRFCGDYRPLNAQTRRDMFLMPLVEVVIDQLGKSTWFSTLDLQSGFWQIQMAPEDVKKTALITKTGWYDWTVMPFGL